MDLLAPIVRWLIVPAWAVWERSPYLQHHKRLLKTQFDASEVIRQRQWNACARLLKHAYETTEFYRGRFEEKGLKPSEIRSFDDFRQIPLLTKNDIRTYQDEIVSTKYDRESLKLTKTSGSTGVSVQIFADEVNDQFGRACVLRADEWSGWRVGERVAMIWGNPEYLKHGIRGRLRNAFLERATYLDTLKMDRSAMARFASALRKRSPSLIMGHAHSIYVFAQFLESTGCRDIRPKGIISTAMVLHEWERCTIEKVFQCPVTNRYGCEEVGLIACQCEQRGGLHINSDAVYLEVLRPDNTPSPSGEVGKVVLTHLTNYPMPFIRYEVGDMAVLSDESCECGRTLPLLERVEGRIADFVITPRGELVSGISLTENFALLVPGIAQLQIVQERIDHIVFRIVKAPDFGPESQNSIRRLVAECFGEDVSFDCEFADRIDQEPSGKYRFCISKVDIEGWLEAKGASGV